MTDKTVVKARVPIKTKLDAEQVFKQLGTDMSTGINMFLAQVAIQGKMPFQVRAFPTEN